MRTRLCFALSLCILLGALILPTSAGDTTPLTLVQDGIAEPGQSCTLTLHIPATQLAGGFFTLQYDASLFLLTNVTLLQATEQLTLTYKDHSGKVNLLLDAAQNVQVDGALLLLHFDSLEEAQPGTYPITCNVPESTSFYALDEDGSTYPLSIGGCSGTLTLSTPALPACPARYLACQETNPTSDGSFYLRLCALADPNATLLQGSYGFVCSVTDAQGTRELTLDGSELLTQIEGGDKVYTATSLGGSIYFATLLLPATGDVTITLSPYVQIDGQTLYGGSYTLLYANGVYMGTSYT